jgi:hypothetical protein
VFALAATRSTPPSTASRSAHDAAPDRERPRPPDVTILVDHYDGRLVAALVDPPARARRVLDDGEEREHALDLLVEKYRQYRGAT